MQTVDVVKCAIGTNHQVHLGGGYYIETFFNSDNVHITKYDKQEDGICSISLAQSIVLTRYQFITISENFDKIQDVTPELSLIIPCYMNEDHQNQMGYAMCPECSPFGDEDC